MVKGCSALNCPNKFEKGADITFHRFPVNKPQLLEKWVNAVGRQNFRPNENSCLCSEHFERSCLLKKYANRRMLKDGAVPSIFRFSNHVQQKGLGTTMMDHRTNCTKEERLNETSVVQSSVGQVYSSGKKVKEELQEDVNLKVYKDSFFISEFTKNIKKEPEETFNEDGAENNVLEEPSLLEWPHNIKKEPELILDEDEAENVLEEPSLLEWPHNIKKEPELMLDEDEAENVFVEPSSVSEWSSNITNDTEVAHEGNQAENDVCRESFYSQCSEMQSSLNPKSSVEQTAKQKQQQQPPPPPPPPPPSTRDTRRRWRCRKRSGDVYIAALEVIAQKICATQAPRQSAADSTIDSCMKFIGSLGKEIKSEEIRVHLMKDLVNVAVEAKLKDMKGNLKT